MNPDDLCMGCLEERGNEKVCPRCQWEEGTPGASPLYLPPRTVLDNQYLLGRVLGHGGFGITYLAWDLTLHRRLAIKEYMPQGIAGRAPGNANVSIYTNEEDYQWGLERFLDEARVVAKFADHPNIMSIINHFADNETAYIVAEYLDGSTLLEYTENEGGTIPYETAARILMPVMDALREVHKSGILHRDISPDNVCITRAGLVKLLDFGAARQALGQKSKNLSVILKEGYAPEEQYRTKGDQGPWTDVYATGGHPLPSHHREDTASGNRSGLSGRTRASLFNGGRCAFRRGSEPAQSAGGPCRESLPVDAGISGSTSGPKRSQASPTSTTSPAPRA